METQGKQLLPDFVLFKTSDGCFWRHESRIWLFSACVDGSNQGVWRCSVSNMFRILTTMPARLHARWQWRLEKWGIMTSTSWQLCQKTQNRYVWFSAKNTRQEQIVSPLSNVWQRSRDLWKETSSPHYHSVCIIYFILILISRERRQWEKSDTEVNLNNETRDDHV